MTNYRERHDSGRQDRVVEILLLLMKIRLIILIVGRRDAGLLTWRIEISHVPEETCHVNLRLIAETLRRELVVLASDLLEHNLETLLDKVEARRLRREVNRND